MTDSPLILKLAYRPPFDWQNLLVFFRAHQVPDLEIVDENGYERVFDFKGQLGVFRVSSMGKGKHSLQLTITGADADAASVIVQSVRRMFDLDADLVQIGKAMAEEPRLLKIWNRHPGLRIARAWDRFETLIGTILGQLVSVGFGRILMRELMESAGIKTLHPKTGESISLFPRPEQLLSHELSSVRTSVARRNAIRGMAALVTSRGLPLSGAVPPKELRKALRSVPGVGDWSAEYMAMRGFEDNDAFPATDYVLKQELKRFPDMNVNNVRPWRAYAAIALWKSFAESKGVRSESVE